MRCVDITRLGRIFIYMDNMETRFELEQLLLNELIFLQKKKEEYWNCHPDNPEGIDPIAEYNKTVHEIGALMEKIKNLNGYHGDI
jgi:hypothetical protein